MYKLAKVGIGLMLAGFAIGIVVLTGSNIVNSIVQNGSTHWCGLFVHSSKGWISKLAVHVSGTQNVYATDANGYVRIYNTGFTNGCPGNLRGLQITASVFYNNTEYGISLLADQNVTLEV